MISINVLLYWKEKKNTVKHINKRKQILIRKIRCSYNIPDVESKCGAYTKLVLKLKTHDKSKFAYLNINILRLMGWPTSALHVNLRNTNSVKWNKKLLFWN